MTEVMRCPYCGFIQCLGWRIKPHSICPDCEMFSWMGQKSHANRFEIFLWKRKIRSVRYYVSKRVRTIITKEKHPELIEREKEDD